MGIIIVFLIIAYYIYNGERERKHEIEMAKLGYEQSDIL